MGSTVTQPRSHASYFSRKTPTRNRRGVLPRDRESVNPNFSWRIYSRLQGLLPNPARRRREWILARGEGRRLATKGTKSTKGRTTDLDRPLCFLCLLWLIFFLHPCVCPGLWTQCSKNERGLKPAT